MRKQQLKEFFDNIEGPEGSEDSVDRETLNAALSNLLGSENIDVSKLEDEEAATIFTNTLIKTQQQEGIVDVLRTLGGSVQDLTEALHVHSGLSLRESRDVSRRKLIFS